MSTAYVVYIVVYAAMVPLLQHQKCLYTCKCNRYDDATQSTLSPHFCLIVECDSVVTANYVILHLQCFARAPRHIL
jgi:hypothetical protein